MEDPPIGQEVVVTLAGGGSCIAYWNGERWMQGVAYNPIDVPLDDEVVTWRWRGD
jgi:hypothetical protein